MIIPRHHAECNPSERYRGTGLFSSVLRVAETNCVDSFLRLHTGLALLDGSPSTAVNDPIILGNLAMAFVHDSKVPSDPVKIPSKAQKPVVTHWTKFVHDSRIGKRAGKCP